MAMCTPPFSMIAALLGCAPLPGGLLMTCGFTQAGGPGTDNGEELGLHGRAHHLAARHVSATADWDGDDYVMRVRGVVEETRHLWRIYPSHARDHQQTGQQSPLHH